MNIVFSRIIFEITTINQAVLNKKRSTQKNTCYKCLILIFLRSLICLISYMFSQSLLSVSRVSRN